MLYTIALLLLLPTISAHASLKWPPSWFDPNGAVGLRTGFKNDACSAGCGSREHMLEGNFNEHCSCMWYEQHSPVPAGTADVLPAYMRTLPAGVSEISGMTPAQAPGTSHVSSSCGLMGGTLQGTMSAVARLQAEGHDMSHFNVGQAHARGYGIDARVVSFPGVVSTQWAAGSDVEVAFGLNAMHGGVYNYRLCRRPADLMNLTEDCFQAGALSFSGTQQWLQFGSNRAHRRSLTAQRWIDPSNNVQWTRLPIPTCSNHAGYVCDGPMFAPPYGVYGYGGENMDGFQVNIVDAVSIPASLEPGSYVLSFRWDVQDGGQVWLQCADIEIVPAGVAPAAFVQPPLPSHIQLLTRFRKGAPMRPEHCQSWCAADDNCLAYEREVAPSTCYHFYTLDFDHAVSHADPYYVQLGDRVPTSGARDWTRWERFIKQTNGTFVSSTVRTLAASNGTSGNMGTGASGERVTSSTTSAGTTSGTTGNMGTTGNVGDAGSATVSGGGLATGTLVGIIIGSLALVALSAVTIYRYKCKASLLTKTAPSPPPAPSATRAHAVDP